MAPSGVKAPPVLWCADPVEAHAVQSNGRRGVARMARRQTPETHSGMNVSLSSSEPCEKNAAAGRR